MILDYSQAFSVSTYADVVSHLRRTTANIARRRGAGRTGDDNNVRVDVYLRKKAKTANWSETGILLLIFDRRDGASCRQFHYGRVARPEQKRRRRRQAQHASEYSNDNTYDRKRNLGKLNARSP